MLDTVTDRPVFTSAAALKLWLSEALALETDPVAILRTTAEAVGRFLGATRIGYGDIEPGEDWMTIPIDWTDGVPSLVGRIPIYRESAFVQAYQRGETMVVSDVRELGLSADEARMLEETFCRSCISVPLVDGGEFVALFSVTYREPRVWTSEEVELVESVGARTWAALDHARATARLRESEEQFRQLAENFPGICWLAGTDGLAYWMNARGLDYYGDTGAAQGDAAAVVHPDDLPAAMALLAEALREGKPVEATVRSRGADGVYRPFLSRMVPIHDEAGAITRWCGVQVDLTEKQSRDRHETFLRQVSEAIRDETNSARILGTVAGALQDHLALARVLFIEFEAENSGYIVHHGATATGELWANRLFRMPEAFVPLHEAFSRGETYVCGDTHILSPLMNEQVRDYYDAQNIRSGINVPLVKEGRLLAILGAQDSKPRTWTPEEVRLVEELAERTWSTITRAQAETALKERERHQRFLVEWSDALREQTSEPAILATTLERLAAHLGTSRANYSAVAEDGRSFTILAEWRRDEAVSTVGNSYRLDSVGEEIRRGFIAGEIVGADDIETDRTIDEAARAAYRRRTVGALLSVPLVRNGQVRAVFSVQQVKARRWREDEKRLLRDVADRAWVVLERARAEAALKARERNRAFLIDWSDAIRAQMSPEGIVAVTIERLGKHLDAARANYAEGDEGGSRFAVLQEWRRDAGSDGALAPRREGLSDGVHEAYLTGDVVVVEDVHADERFDEGAKRSYAAVDAVSFLGVPMIRGGQVCAVLSVQHARAHRWRSTEVQLLRDVADRVWVMLERARAEAALQERERNQAFMIEWSDAVRAETGPRGILSVTLDRLARYLEVERINYAEVVEPGDQFEVMQEWNGGSARLSGRRFPFAALGERVIADHQTGRPLAVNDVTTHPLFDEQSHALYAAVGVRAVVTVPLVTEGRMAAVLSVQQSSPRAWSEAEVRLICEIADRTWATLDRARFEQRMADSEALLATFMENAPIGMHLKDAAGRYIRINQEVAAAYGRPREDILGQCVSELLEPEAAQEVERAERQAKAGRTVSVEIERETEDRYASALSIAFPIQGHGAARMGGFTIDLTDRKAAEAALQRSREALYQTEKLSALGSLLAGVSHELNNPLSIVVAQAVMMERQALGTELADRAFKIRRAADRCARIVQTFLAMARAKRPEREPVDLNAVAVAALDLADYGMRTDGVTVERRLAPGLPRIAADADQLHQVIINLLVNAQQAMKEAGTPDLRLVVTTERGPEPDTVVLDVADNGPGVPEELRRRIFEPFFTTKPQGEGTGVGLSFSQGLAEAHGGRLALLPSETGAAFRLTLPIDSSLTLPCVAPEPAAPGPAGGRRALVVDDEREIAESLADFLSVEGFECEVAIGGAAAKERLADGYYDLIVSDLRMPGIDGPELHAWIADARPDLAPRMAFTTGDTLGAAAERFIAGVDRPVLEKPFTPDSVRELIARVEASA